MGVQVDRHGGVGGHTIRWKWDNEYVIHFSVYRIAAEGDDGYEYRALDRDEYFTQDLDRAEVYFKGDLKWDGCCDIDFGDVCLHLCGHEDAIMVCNLISSLWVRAAELMGFDKANLR